VTIVPDYLLSLKGEMPVVVRVYSEEVEMTLHRPPHHVARTAHTFTQEAILHAGNHYSPLALHNLVRTSAHGKRITVCLHL